MKRVPSPNGHDRAQQPGMGFGWIGVAVIALIAIVTVVTGGASGRDLWALVAIVAVSFGLVVLDWRSRRVRRREREDANVNAATRSPTAEPRPAESDSDLPFIIALIVTVVGTMALLGFPGGALGQGLIALAALALLGWYALRRTIGG